MAARFRIGDQVVLLRTEGPVTAGSRGTVVAAPDAAKGYQVQFDNVGPRTVSDNHLAPPPLPLYRVLEEEYEAVHADLPPAPGGEPHSAAEHAERIRRLHTLVHALPEGRAALCLSGGGIRSATFCLGVIQALARAGVLSKFHYLSTVSGGGYIGSWLSAWAGRHQAGVKGVEAELRSSAGPAEPPEVRWLRQYSNYLSPRRGLMSADTWVLAASFFRNLLLNWLVLLPLMATALMLPRLGVWLATLPQWLKQQGHEGLLLALAVALLVVGAVVHVYTVAYRHAHRPSQRGGGDKGPGERAFISHVLAPLVASGAMLMVGWAALRGAVPLHEFWPVVLGCMMALAVVIGGAGVAWGQAMARGAGGAPRTVPPARARLAQLFSLLLEGAVAGALLWLVAKRPWADPVAHPRFYATMALPMYLMVFVTAAIVGRALVTQYAREDDREWSARGAGWVMMAAVAWLAAGGLVLFAPSLLLHLHTQARAALLSVGGAAGVVTALLARSPLTSATSDLPAPAGRGPVLREWGLRLAAPLFIVFLVTVLALATDWLVTRLDKQTVRTAGGRVETLEGIELYRHHARALAAAEAAAAGGAAPDHGMLVALPVGADRMTVQWQPARPAPRAAFDWHRAVLVYGHLLPILMWMAVLPVVGFLMSWFVDVNKYSLNGVYRNRLVRAYLGASRRDRPSTADAFTGFDHRDSPRLPELPVPRAGRAGPFHVVNMALNLVRGDDLAWQQRKAQNFTATPLHCGSGELRDLEGNRTGAYRPSSEYGGGGAPGRAGSVRPLSLGTVMSVSGAAASPNMGYHSSAAMTFLMTLLNVRLGAWLGNPGYGGGRTYRDRAPRLSVRALWDEALGRTNDRGRYVYLSDGGHFENLGLYEMVRRRCRYVVAVDAGQDKACQFADLGNALRKIYIDMGARIEFGEGMKIYPRGSDRADGQYVAIGRIRYAAAGDQPPTVGGTAADIDGWLLYIKPAFYGTDEPPDIRNYAALCTDFPHETTADQFFSESQFESYRALGSYIVDRVLKEPAALKGFGDLLKSPP